MASTNQSEERKLEILQRIEESRNSVLGAKILLDEQISNTLNVPKRLKNSFSEKPAKSFGIALATGLGASLLLRAKSKRKKKKAQLLQFSKPAKSSLLSGVAIAVLKPVIQKLIVQYSQQWIAQRTAAPQAQAATRPHETRPQATRPQTETRPQVGTYPKIGTRPQTVTTAQPIVRRPRGR